MQTKLILILVGLFVATLPGAARAQNISDSELYQQALEQIIEHDHPKQFAVWDQAISASVLASVIVPRHSPNSQFLRSMRGVTADLELTLLYNSIDARGLSGEAYVRRLNNFDVKTAEGQFLGFSDKTKLQQMEESASHLGIDQKPLVIGFSRVGYKLERGQLHALFYTEIGLLGEESSYGGEGFLFVKQDGKWHLKSHAYLWQGQSNPFWKW
jgi:hypothetical protein